MKDTTKGSTEISIIMTINISLVYIRDIVSIYNLLIYWSISIDQTTYKTMTIEY